MNCISPVFVRLPPQLTTETAESLVEDLSRALSGFPPGVPPHVTLHAEETTWCGVAGIQPVVAGYRAVTDAGGTFTIAGCSQALSAAIRDFGFADLLKESSR